MCRPPPTYAQKEDLARMYRLFQRIPRGLDPVAEIFRRHVESEGMKLVKEVTDAMQSKKEKDAGARARLQLCMARRFAGSTVEQRALQHPTWAPQASAVLLALQVCYSRAGLVGCGRIA